MASRNLPLLNVVSNNYPPYVTHKNGTFSGPMIELLKALARSIGFQYKISIQQEQGRLVKGSWTGAMGMLFNNTVDLAAMPFMVNEQRYPAVWFTPHVMAQDIRILAGKNKGTVENDIDYFAPMYGEMWLGLFFIILTITILYYIIHRVDRSLFKKKCTDKLVFIKYFIHIASTTYGEGITEVDTNFQAERVLVGFFWLVSLTFSFWWCSFLSANMVVNDGHGKIKTIKDLASLKDIIPVVIKGTSVVSIFQNSKDKDFNKVWRNMLKFGENVTILPAKEVYSIEMFHRVKASEVAIVAGHVSSDFKLAEHCSDMNDGEFYFADESFFPHFISMAVSKHMDVLILNKIQNKMRRMSDAGIVSYMFQLLKMKMKQCITDDTDTTFSVLEIQSVRQAFFILLGGFAIGFITLLLEFLFHRTGKSKARLWVERNKKKKLDVALPCKVSYRMPPFLPLNTYPGQGTHDPGARKATTASRYGRRRIKPHNFWALVTSEQNYDDYFENQYH